MRKHLPFSLLGLALGNNELINKYICNQCHLEEIMFVSLAIEDNINTVPSPLLLGGEDSAIIVYGSLPRASSSSAISFRSRSSRQYLVGQPVVLSQP